MIRSMSSHSFMRILGFQVSMMFGMNGQTYLHNKVLTKAQEAYLHGWSLVKITAWTVNTDTTHFYTTTKGVLKRMQH